MIWKKNPSQAFWSELEVQYSALWRFSRVLTGSTDAADDLAQSTVLRAMEKHQQFKIGTSMKAWLFTICRNLWLNELRSRSVRERGGLVDVSEIEIADKTANTETNILAGEVFRAMMALPEAQRITAYLVYVEGHRYSEAAELLDIPIGTVMSRLAAVRKALSKYSKEDAS